MEQRQNRFDLHMHSNCSDGSDRPEEVARLAAEAGLSLMALTDHDCVRGVAEAAAAGVKYGVAVLPAVEMDTEWPSELHVLGLGIDVDEPRLINMLETACRRRAERNEMILERLEAAGCGVRQTLDRPVARISRLHIALALVAAGHAQTVPQAFERYLRRGAVGYYAVRRFSPEEVVAGILGAGGVPVWAHPFHGGQDITKMLAMLKSAGIRGLEAYHPSASAGESAILLSLAKQNGLLVTCGSDSHGANRPGVMPGCTWRETPELAETYAFFANRLTYGPGRE